MRAALCPSCKDLSGILYVALTSFHQCPLCQQRPAPAATVLSSARYHTQSTDQVAAPGQKIFGTGLYILPFPAFIRCPLCQQRLATMKVVQLPYAPYAETPPRPSSMLPLPACTNAHPVNRGAFLQQQSMLLTTLYKQCSCRPTHTQPLIPVQICITPLCCPHQPASMPVLSTKSLSCKVSINT